MLKHINEWSGEENDAVLCLDSYTNNGRIYIGLLTFDKEMEYWEPWCDITVNIPMTPLTDRENCAFVDINNDPTITKFLKQNGLAKPTGRFAQSGWVTYPEYQFDMDKVRQNLDEGVL
jgi:hypothetical protein